MVIINVVILFLDFCVIDISDLPIKTLYLPKNY